MIEKAVERSREEGYDGNLELISDNADSISAYLALGFQELGKSSWSTHRLDPTNRAEWDTKNAQYRLVKYMNKKFAT